MGGFFGVASKTDCTLELFYGVDYLPIWEPEEEEWQHMERMDSTEQFIIFRIPLSEQSLSGMWRR